MIKAAWTRGKIDVADCKVAANHLSGVIRDNLHLQIILDLLRKFIVVVLLSAAIAKDAASVAIIELPRQERDGKHRGEQRHALLAIETAVAFIDSVTETYHLHCTPQEKS